MTRLVLLTWYILWPYLIQWNKTSNRSDVLLLLEEKDSFLIGFKLRLKDASENEEEKEMKANFK